MANTNFNPNARYDTGPNAAGTGRITSPQPAANRTGLGADGVVSNSDIRTGTKCAGGSRTKGGPNVAGAPRSYNND